MATKNRRRKRRKSDAKQINALAGQLAKAQFAPGIAQAKAEIRGVERRRPQVDAAYQGLAQEFGNVASAQQGFTRELVGQQQAAGGAMVDLQAQLGAEQAQRAGQDAAAFGQTAKAAEQAAELAQGAAGTLASATQDSGAFLGALGAVQSGQARSLGANTEQHRLEAQKGLDTELLDARRNLANVKGQRGAARAEIAQGLMDDLRDYQLALLTLNQRDAESMRDFRLQRKALLQRMREFNATQALEGAKLDLDADQQAHDQAQDTRDTDGDGVPDTMDRAPATPGDETPSQKGKGPKDATGRRRHQGEVKLKTGDGFRWVTATQRRAIRTKEAKVKTWAASDPKNAPRGVKPWQVEVGKFVRAGRPIPKRYKPFLVAYFGKGMIPRSIGKLLED